MLEGDLLDSQLQMLLNLYDNPLTPISSLNTSEKLLVKELLAKKLINCNILILSLTEEGKKITRTILENREAEKYSAYLY